MPNWFLIGVLLLLGVIAVSQFIGPGTRFIEGSGDRRRSPNPFATGPGTGGPHTEGPGGSFGEGPGTGPPNLREDAGGGACERTSTGLVPLTELGSGEYQGFEGGLYPDGANEPPAAYLQQGLRLARSIRPLDESGDPDPNGQYALVSIGMSNTTLEFKSFIGEALEDGAIDQRLVVVDGAEGGAGSFRWANPDDRVWEMLDHKLSIAGVTPEQVAVAWVKVASIAGRDGGWPEHAQVLSEDMESIASLLGERFPNLKIAYYSSRTYGGYASSGLNPEPFAYESGFSVKWLVERAIRGELPDSAPFVTWGPYLWADGRNSRDDGLRWNCRDFVTDGTHPSPTGVAKVADQLMEFFSTDPAAREWFLAD